MPRDQVTDGEILDTVAFGIKASIYKIAPGIVVAYHAGVAGKSQPSVDVQPATDDVRTDTETGALVPEPWPIIPQVPLAMAKGGGASIAFAMKQGDPVLLLSFDQDPTGHRGTGNTSPPFDTSRHTGGHWIALPFDITDPGALADPGANLVVTPPPGGLVLVGPDATEFAALANVVDSNFKALTDWLKLLTTTKLPTYIDAPAPAAVPTVYPGDPPPAMAAVACTLLKAK